MAAGGISTGCEKTAFDSAGLACKEGECLDGFVCHPQRGLCVPVIAVGCGGSQSICPSTTQQGDPCPSPGSFLPCVDGARECEQGCRTCEATGWSECAGCTTGTVDACSACDDDCLALANVNAASCDTSGVAPMCVITGCATGFTDTDGQIANGCESACTPSGDEVCNGQDDDCNGDVDDVAPAALTTECAGVFPSAAGVASWRCTGACEIGTCANGQHDVNNNIGDGCEYACTVVGSETCDGTDEDCDGTADNMGQGALDTDCSGKNSGAVHVATWSCNTGACEIASCEAGWSDLSGGIADGCEASCIPTSPSDEVCDTVDNDCDGIVDNEGATGCQTFFRDRDGDGFGDDADTRCLCAAAGQYSTTTGGDCDDTIDTCTTDCTTDVDADGATDCADTCLDFDLDNYGSAGGAGNTCAGADCNDSVATCTTDCTTNVDGDIIPDCADTCLDKDGDGYGNFGGGGNTCTGADCDDGDAAINLGATDTPDDGIDQDCSGTDTITCIVDADQDTYGTDAGTTVLAPDGT